MIYKKLFFTLSILSITKAATAMEQPVAAGTFITPLHHHGQFTVHALPKKIQQTNSFIFSSHVADLYKTKGEPVLISLATSNVPWWALTTGTGYLLISQAQSLPMMLSAACAGSSYALGQCVGNEINEYITNLKLKYLLHAALLSVLMSIMYASSNDISDESCCAFAQALVMQIVLQVVIQSMQKLNTPSNKPTSTIAPSTDTAIHSLVDAMHTGACSALMYSFGMAHSELIKILLYEQAYRLAQQGYKKASELFNVQPNNKD